MKKLFFLLPIFTSLIMAVSSCKTDNFPYPDAVIAGAIRDSVGIALVETDLVNGSTFSAYELGGYETPVVQTWLIKNSGEFQNKLVYANTYKIQFINCNFFPYVLNDFVIKSGNNQQDFLVIPYIRIKNATITYDASGNKINASFTLEAGKPTVQVSKITLYTFTDIYVGEYIKFSTVAGTGQISQTFSGAARTINPATVYNLSIDLNTNANLFAIHRNYYFRVGALAIQSGVGTVRTNYTTYVKIAL